MIHLIFTIILLSFSTELFASERVTDKSKWKRDPFLFKESRVETRITQHLKLKSKSLTNSADKKSEEPDFNIQGILKTGNNRYDALINGTIVKIGDSILEYKIVDIKSHQVSFRKGKDKMITYDIYQGKLDRGKK